MASPDCDGDTARDSAREAACLLELPDMACMSRTVYYSPTSRFKMRFVVTTIFVTTSWSSWTTMYILPSTSSWGQSCSVCQNTRRDEGSGEVRRTRKQS